MGSFSWNKADKLTQVENVAYGKSFKFLIPKEFGGGFIKDTYQDYGFLGTKEGGQPKHDMYELQAFWNKAEGLKYDGEYPHMKEIDEHTDDNRSLGIHIGCYDKEILNLKFPLKLVSPSFKGTYEDCPDCSLGDPDQGWGERKRKKEVKFDLGFNYDVEETKVEKVVTKTVEKKSDLRLIPYLNAMDFDSQEMEDELSDREVSTHCRDGVFSLYWDDEDDMPETKKWLVEKYGEGVKEYTTFTVQST